MGIGDRQYYTRESGGGFGGGGGMMVGMPKPAPAVKILLLINIAVFVVQMLADGFMMRWFGVLPEAFWQIHRYLTFQFLHSTQSLFHILFNMLGLYMLGTPLENHWGSKRFVRFYLICGAVGGLMYAIVGNMISMRGVPLIGASGGVYAVVLACAILFPHIRLILILFPVPIRFACVLIFGFMIFNVLGPLTGGGVSAAFWSDVCHLGGAGAAALWIWVLPKMSQKVTMVKATVNEGTWERRMQQRLKEEQEIDRILAKIKEKGILSLSEKEKKTLQQATKRQQHEDRKMFKL